MYSTTKEFPVQFVNAFDNLQEQRRKLFNIPEIDNLLNYSDKKNICIVNRESKNAIIIIIIIIIFYILFLRNFVLNFIFLVKITLAIRKTKPY